MYCYLPYATLLLSGESSEVFMQGLFSNNINNLQENNSVQYSLMLNAVGRYMFDFFIIKHNNSYLINIHNDSLENFVTVLKMYKLRAKVNIEISKYHTYALFNINNKEIVSNLLKSSSVIFKDPRLDILGYRVLTETDIIKNSNEVEANINEYTKLRFENTVPEATELIKEKSIPIEWGLDELNAISYNKGCYLGQEFTNSAKHKLLIRKRLVTINSNNNAFYFNDDILNSEQKKIGSIKAIFNNYSFALVNMKEALSSKTFTVNNKEVNIIIPDWIKSYSLE